MKNYISVCLCEAKSKAAIEKLKQQARMLDSSGSSCGPHHFTFQFVANEKTCTSYVRDQLRVFEMLVARLLVQKPRTTRRPRRSV